MRAVVVSALMLTMILAILAPVTVQAAGPEISSIQASAVTVNSAVISWITNSNATGNVDYGTASGGPYASAPTTPDTTADNTSHAVVLTGLTGNTTYYYVVRSSDGTDETTSAEQSFTTRAFTISEVTASSITLTSATIIWNTSAAATSNVEYGLDASYGSTAPAVEDTSADSTIHVVNLTGLTPDSTYHYRVKSENASGDEEVSADFTFVTLSDTTPPAISDVAPSGTTLTTTTTAAVTWTTDEATTSQVEYGTTSATHGSYDSTSVLDSTLVTSHSVLLSGLSPDTTYYYRVMSTDAYDNSTVSSEYSFTTAADLTQPVISSITVSGLTTTTAIISWDTNEPATTQVEYGTTTAYGSSSLLDASLVSSHTVVLTGLTPGVTYHYRVKSADGSSNEAVSLDHTFATASDATAPVISDVTAGGITASSATITWNTDESSNSQVEYGTTTSYGSTTTLDTNYVFAHSVSITGLSSGVTYHYRVKSIDPSGNVATSTDYTFTTADVIPPTAPANVAQTTSAADNTPTFTWDAATDSGLGVDYYQVSLDSGSYTDVGNVTTFTVAAADALDDGSHVFSVRAVDNAGNVGDAESLSFNIDATPPTTPEDLTRTTPDRVNTPTFTWTEADDATSGLERYQVRIDSGTLVDVGTLTTFTVPDEDALADGTHVFEVRAVDRAGNAGEIASLSFTIDATAPTAPANITRTTPDGDDTPTFTWDAAIDETSGVDYYLYRIDSGEFVEIGDVTTLTVADADALASGSHIFEIKAVDGAGNIGEAGSIAFQIAGPSSWGMIIGIIAGVLVAVGVAAFLLGGRHAARPTRGKQNSTTA